MEKAVLKLLVVGAIKAALLEKEEILEIKVIQRVLVVEVGMEEVLHIPILMALAEVVLDISEA